MKLLLITEFYFLLKLLTIARVQKEKNNRTKRRGNTNTIIACYHLIICFNSLLSQLPHQYVSFGYCSHPFAHPSCMEL